MEQRQAVISIPSDKFNQEMNTPVSQMTQSSGMNMYIVRNVILWKWMVNNVDQSKGYKGQLAAMLILQTIEWMKQRIDLLSVSKLGIMKEPFFFVYKLF